MPKKLKLYKRNCPACNKNSYKHFYNYKNFRRMDAYGKIYIIGVGGIDSGKSAYDKLLAGASFLQLYTGMVYQGPNIVSKIKKELKQILTDKKVKNFKEIIGKNDC